MATIKHFINSNNIRAEIEWADSNPNMPDSHMVNHWRVTLKRGRKQMTVPFSGGSLVTHIEADDVLNALALDANGFDNARSFEEWAEEYGYDTDSRSAERTYKAIERQRNKLHAFLGPDLYDQLVWNTESL